jgi:class 3 adenylate cyclase
VGWSVGEIRYIETERGHVGYRVGGAGSVDYMTVIGSLWNLDATPDEDSMEPDHPIASTVRLFARIEAHARCIMFDRSGCGCSDPLPTGVELTVEDAVEDLLAVMDAVGSTEVVANGVQDGAAIAIALAALYPDRCRALILANASASLRRHPGYPVGLTDDEAATVEESLCAGWGTVTTSMRYPGEPTTRAQRIASARIQRLIAKPGTIRTHLRACFDADVRHYLDAVRCPTLIIHGRSSPLPGIEHARYLAQHIAGARLVEVEAGAMWWEDPDSPAVDAWEEFVTGLPPVRTKRRRLVTVMFTDIVGSTETVASSGDAVWRRRLEVHDRCCRRVLLHYEGEFVKSTGDGILALFNSPSDAVNCATELQRELADNGISIRIGLHTGEVEVRDQDVGGIAVHIAARIQAQAEPDTILVSEVIPPLVKGAGTRFIDRGVHTLKGIETPQRLYSVVG